MQREKASWAFQEGDEIAPGRFAMKRLGGGKLYEVYLVWDERLFALAVAKIVRPDQTSDPAAARQITAEAEILSRLTHPVILRMFDVVVEGARPHLLLEHLEGPTLRSLIKRQRRLPIEQLLPLALEVASALHYLRGKAVVHLDIKPSNIVMGAPPRLVDFSIARYVEEAARITSPVGTDAYMAPEQCEPVNRPSIGPPADMWGLGATIYHAMSGRLPFPRVGNEAKRFPQVDREPDPVDRDVPDILGEAIGRCLGKEPLSRPQPSEFALSLRPLIEALPRHPILGRRRSKLR